MRMLMACGGTGGHIIPALTVAQRFQQRVPNAEISFVGTAKGMEVKLVPEAGFRLELISVEGVKGKSLAQRLKSLWLLPVSFLKAFQVLKKVKPDIVFGVGGYVSGPVLLLASIQGKVTAILEPNAIPGFSNKILARLVKKIFVAFREATSEFPALKVIHSGNPIRQNILAIAPPDFKSSSKTILIFGGSQGARRINEAVVEMLPKLKAKNISFSFIHQTGSNDFEKVKQAYLSNGFNAKVYPFIDKMDQAYQASTIIIARSGSSVLEIAACGRPSILVPYPFAADDHQTANAKVLQSAGAAIVIDDAFCSGQTLMDAVETINQGDTLKRMSQAALSLRYEKSTDIIINEMLAMEERQS
ncbi:MAG: undecaprenyldiphospho-muramoylpentapeptide beta-N-acetylglucosaminyltransferase [Bdellovibrionales bacterium]|nr:undecaprenyldiphospho-muramoylpentapeptide beta-N-acetylglucosaminyltransferase [Bdellovibrionales bacterium]